MVEPAIPSAPPTWVKARVGRGMQAWRTPTPMMDRGTVGIPDQSDKLHVQVTFDLTQCKDQMRLYSTILEAITPQPPDYQRDPRLEFLREVVLDGPDYWRDQVMPVITPRIVEAFYEKNVQTQFSFEQWCRELIVHLPWHTFWNTGDMPQDVFANAVDKAATTLVARR